MRVFVKFSETADTSTNNHQIFLTSVRRGITPILSALQTQLVRDIEGTTVAATKTALDRRIVVMG